jgi:hypothetical protein
MYCALLACHDQIHDPHEITEGLHDELRELLGRAQQREADPTRDAGAPLGALAAPG